MKKGFLKKQLDVFLVFYYFIPKWTWVKSVQHEGAFHLVKSSCNVICGGCAHFSLSSCPARCDFRRHDGFVRDFVFFFSSGVCCSPFKHKSILLCDVTWGGLHRQGPHLPEELNLWQTFEIVYSCHPAVDLLIYFCFFSLVFVLNELLFDYWKKITPPQGASHLICLFPFVLLLQTKASTYWTPLLFVTYSHRSSKVSRSAVVKKKLEVSTLYILVLCFCREKWWKWRYSKHYLHSSQTITKLDDFYFVGLEAD